VLPAAVVAGPCLQSRRRADLVFRESLDRSRQWSGGRRPLARRPDHVRAAMGPAWPEGSVAANPVIETVLQIAGGSIPGTASTAGGAVRIRYPEPGSAACRIFPQSPCPSRFREMQAAGRPRSRNSCARSRISVRLAISDIRPIPGGGEPLGPERAGDASKASCR